MAIFKPSLSDAKERNVFYTHQKRNMSNRIHYSSKKEFVLGLLKPKDESLLVCGAGGSRTLVQTRKPYAFYMLIFA